MTDNEIAAYRKRLIDTTTPVFQLLIKAQGMEYRQFYYNAAYWTNLIGEDITLLIGAKYVEVNRNGLCGLTSLGIKHLEAYYGQVGHNWDAIGI